MEGEKGARCVFDEAIAFPAALVLGSEEKGPSKSVLKACDGLLYVPMARPFDSLNVAQAGAILLGELARRQRM
jgi:23S rRNA (guanosine2251-2'-O)-methyltransferase